MPRKKTPPPIPPRLRRSPKPERVAKPKRAILLMGATGAGKSSFIAAATGLPAKIGHKLHSCTTDPEGWKYEAEDKSLILLIDTPGFNDSKRPDTELLKSIVEYIHENRLYIITVIYIHPITERKLTGSTKVNLRMLRAFCGDHFFQNIVLVTSMWTTMPAEETEEAVQREGEFTQSSDLWGEILEKGAAYFRWDDTEQVANSKTAEQIVETCRGRDGAPPLNIFWEMEKGKPLADTTAGKILTEELRKRQEKERQALLEEQEEMIALQEQKSSLEATLGRMQEDVRTESQACHRRGSHPSTTYGAQLSHSGPSILLPHAHPLQRRYTEGGQGRDVERVPHYRHGDDSANLEDERGWRERVYEREREERKRRANRSGRSMWELVWVRRRR